MPGMKCLDCTHLAVQAWIHKRDLKLANAEKARDRAERQNAATFAERMKKKRDGTPVEVKPPFTPAGPNEPQLRCIHMIAPTGACGICHPREAKC